MQQTGTLRKRRRRNLSKVNGLSIIPYEDELDTFTGWDLFRNDENEAGHFRQLLLPSAYRRTSFGNKSGDDIDPEAGLGPGRQNTSGYRGQRDISSNTRRFSPNEISGYRTKTFVSARNRVTRNPNFHSVHVQSADEELGKWTDENLTSKQIPTTRNQRGSVLEERSHFLSPIVMRRLKTLIYLGRCAGTFPWKWNSKKYCVDKWSPIWEKIWWIHWFVITIQTSFLLCVQTQVFSESFKTTVERTNREIFMSCFGILWYMYALCLNLNFFLFKEKFLHYINTLLKFNHDYVSKYLIHLDNFKDRGGPVMNLCFFGILSEIFISASFFIRMPFQPWYLFSYIYPKPWYWLIPGTLQDMTMVGQVNSSCLLLSWIIVCHTNSLQFWLRNNNDSDYTIDELRRPKNALAIYKILQVLNTQFNECMSPLAFYVLKVVWISAMVPMSSFEA